MSELELWDAARAVIGPPPERPNLGIPIGFDTRIGFPLFKATKREFADAFFRDGSLRLGTVWDYRKQEHPLGIADAHEGLRFMACDDGEMIVGVLLNSKDSYVFCTSEDEDRTRFTSAGYDAAYRIDDVRFMTEILAVLQQTIELEGLAIAKIMYESNEDMAAETTRRLRLGIDEAFAVPPVGFWKNPAEAYQREVRALFSPTIDPNAGRYVPIGDSIAPDDLVHHGGVLSLLQPIDLQVPGAIQYATAW